ncbi:MAG: tryptophan--tRNA ligase [Candidatus Niyogibacteria bacterium]|nr:tryptophan--tRNA ligase [Candidatus Niyogibacteria bacterium]
MIKNKQIILSAMRPTGELHLGHYFSVLKNWVKLQDFYRCFYMIADLHALTTFEDTAQIKKNTVKMAALWLAAGLNPKKSTLFIQSKVPEHSELAVILGMISPLSLLELNPTYKEMKAEHPKSNTLGLLSYPVLQAADILLYKAERVPIGQDQAPHLELARELARRFNRRFSPKGGIGGEVLKKPAALFEKTAKIMSLQDPTKKMSKSADENSYISLLDLPEKIRHKIKRAVTDSGREIKYSAQKPALSNLIALYQLAADKNREEIEKKFEGLGYKEFKKEMAEEIIGFLTPLQKRYQKLMENTDKIRKILENGSKTARKIANRTLAEIKKTIGI